MTTPPNTPAGGAVCLLTTYEDMRAVTARIHDFAWTLPPGTYSLYTQPPATVSLDAVLAVAQHMQDIADVAERYTVDELRDVLREKADELESLTRGEGNG